VLIKSFEVTDPHRVGKIEVELHGRIKDCKALTYRQDLRAKEIEQYRVRMLPTRQVFAYLLILMSLSLSLSLSLFFFGEPHLLASTCPVTPPPLIVLSSYNLSLKFKF
jgi:hypothetical protein